MTIEEETKGKKKILKPKFTQKVLLQLRDYSAQGAPFDISSTLVVVDNNCIEYRPKAKPQYWPQRVTVGRLGDEGIMHLEKDEINQFLGYSERIVNKSGGDEIKISWRE